MNYSNKKQDDDLDAIIRKPPTSCVDLNNHFGYTLNGIYFVKKNNLNSDFQIDVVFCDFQPTGGTQQRTSQSGSVQKLHYINSRHIIMRKFNQNHLLI